MNKNFWIGLCSIPAILFLSCSVLGDRNFSEFWQSLAQKTQVSLSDLHCVQPWNSRAGFCTFVMEPKMLEQLTQGLDLIQANRTEKYYTQDYGCQKQKIFDQSKDEVVEIYVDGIPGSSPVTEGQNPLLHDQGKNIKFDSLFYNREIQRGCVQLHYPYG